MNRIGKGMLMLIAGICVSCGSQTTKREASLDLSEKVDIKHLSGTTNVGKNPQRVVILQYGMLDTFDELGLDKLVKGIPLSELPEYLHHFGQQSNMVGLGTTMEANMEKLNELDPDLIIIGSRMSPKYSQFSSIAPTINLEPDKKDFWKSFSENHLAIAKLYGREKDVSKKLAQLKARVDQLKKRTVGSKDRALIVLTNEGRLSIYGQGSRFGLIHDVFGILPVDSNIAVSSHGQSISNEYIKEANPDIIFVIDRGAALKTTHSSMAQFVNPLVAQTSAYKKGKIFFLDPEIWYLSGGGLKSFELMLDEIEKTVS